MIYSLGTNEPRFEGDAVYIAPTATVIGRVVLHQDTSIWFNAVIRGDCDDIILGPQSNVQDGAVLHADIGYPISIGQGVTIGHKAMLHGCTICSNVLIGMNATVLNGAVIGENSIIGANALVTEGKTIPPNSLVIGAPGKVVRNLTEAEIAHNREAAQHYVDNGKRYQQEFRPQR